MPCMWRGKMAVLNDRKYIGFEISKEYFDIACQRLDDVEYPKFFSLKVQETEQGKWLTCKTNIYAMVGR